MNPDPSSSLINWKRRSLPKTETHCVNTFWIPSFFSSLCIGMWYNICLTAALCCKMEDVMGKMEDVMDKIEDVMDWWIIHAGKGLRRSWPTLCPQHWGQTRLLRLGNLWGWRWHYTPGQPLPLGQSSWGKSTSSATAMDPSHAHSKSRTKSLSDLLMTFTLGNGKQQCESCQQWKSEIPEKLLSNIKANPRENIIQRTANGVPGKWIESHSSNPRPVNCY